MSALGQLLTVEEAAPRLGMPEAMVRREIRARRLKVLRRGRAIGIYEAWLKEYVDAHTEAAGETRGRMDEEPAVMRPTGITDLLPARPALRVN